MIQLETERLILRNFTEQDYPDLYELLSQRRDDPFEGYPGITWENGREHMAYRAGSDDFAAMELKGSGKIIGNVYFAPRDFNARELGYIVNKDYQRKGYASEAVRALLSYGFAGGAHRVFAECDPRNACSWGLLEHLGFRREALLKQNIYFRKDENGLPLWQDTCVYALLAEEWKA